MRSHLFYNLDKISFPLKMWYILFMCSLVIFLCLTKTTYIKMFPILNGKSYFILQINENKITLQGYSYAYFLSQADILFHCSNCGKGFIEKSKLK